MPGLCSRVFFTSAVTSEQVLTPGLALKLAPNPGFLVHAGHQAVNGPAVVGL